jgi:hypothetical protein
VKKNAKIKKRRNKTQKKHSKGGKINHLSLSTRIPIVNVEIPYSEIEFAISKLDDSLEYCGKYVIDYVSTDNDSTEEVSTEEVSTDDVSRIQSGATCILKRHDHNPGEIDTTGRARCDLREKELYGIVWHTHPHTSKFYPSEEDIVMVKKKRKGEKIKLSVIYTSIGIWLLESLGDNLDKKKIEKINKEFYKKCFGGRTTTSGFNLDDVLNHFYYYKRDMSDYCEMNINFKPYPINQKINAILTDVRIDALTP